MNDICAITLEKPIIPHTLDCGHTFEKYEIKKWLKNSEICPLCKKTTLYHDVYDSWKSAGYDLSIKYIQHDFVRKIWKEKGYNRKPYSYYFKIIQLEYFIRYSFHYFWYEYIKIDASCYHLLKHMEATTILMDTYSDSIEDLLDKNFPTISIDKIYGDKKYWD